MIFFVANDLVRNIEVVDMMHDSKGTRLEMGSETITSFPHPFLRLEWHLQVIVNKSRVQWRGLDLNLPVKLTAFEKLPTITHEIRSMLQSQPKVYLDDEQPRCHVSRVGPASFNLAITCNLQPMVSNQELDVSIWVRLHKEL